MIDTDDLLQILVEVETGKPPTRTDPEAMAARERLQLQCQEIRAKGGAVEIPHELPRLDSLRPQMPEKY